MKEQQRDALKSLLFHCESKLKYQQSCLRGRSRDSYGYDDIERAHQKWASWVDALRAAIEETADAG